MLTCVKYFSDLRYKLKQKRPQWVRRGSMAVAERSTMNLQLLPRQKLHWSANLYGGCVEARDRRWAFPYVRRAVAVTMAWKVVSC